MSEDVNGSPEECRLGYRTCPSCERSHHVRFLVEGICPQCRGEEKYPLTPEQRAREKATLFRSTAKVLREIGYPDRAQWYEAQIQALELEAKEKAS